MLENLIYLEFNDVENDDTENTGGEEPKESTEGKTEKEENKKEEKPKKSTNKTDKTKNENVTITKEQFKEYENLKQSSMTGEQKEQYLQSKIDSLETKVETLNDLLSERNSEISQLKNKDLVKEELNKIKNDKPYLTTLLDKRISKSEFTSVDDIKSFVDLVDSEEIKQAYEISQKTGKADKLGTRTDIPNVLNQGTTNKQNFKMADPRKYGLK